MTVILRHPYCFKDKYIEAYVKWFIDTYGQTTKGVLP